MHPSKAPRALIAALLGSCGLALAGSTDLSVLPPDPSEMKTALSACMVNLEAAIRAAEASTGGKATRAEFLPGASGVYEVICYTDEAAIVALVKSEDGSIVSTKATPRLPGEPISVPLQSTESGLLYVDMVVGTGAQPAAANSTVTVHYSGWLTDGTPFDSSRDRGQPITLSLARFVPGWAEGVSTMKVGGKRKLVIPYSLAYGPQGRPPVIPPKAMLIFDVELLGVEEPAAPPAPAPAPVPNPH